MANSVACWLIYQGAVLLQKRAETEIINGVERNQSFPFLHQPSWNGKIEEEEEGGEGGIIKALKRECREELGAEFAQIFHFPYSIFEIEEYWKKGKRGVGYNFKGTVSKEELRLVKLHSGAFPYFIAITREYFPEIKIFGSPGANPKKDIVMLKSQYSILKKLFQISFQ